MSANVFDRLFVSAPVNKSAALVTAKGDEYVSCKRIVNHHWDAPPVCQKMPENTQENLVGLSVGALRVVSFFESSLNKKKPARWLVRCVCGAYETRQRSAIKNPNNSNDCCAKCQHLRYLRKRASHNHGWVK